MHKFFFAIRTAAFSFILMTGCKTAGMLTVPKSFPAFYKEGHRGTRGLMPENTIPTMLKALDAGANVLEVDVYTTRDGNVLIAHDPYLNTDHSLINGSEVSKEEAKQYIWHQMNYADIKKIDVGSKVYKAFPQQEKRLAYMPLLGELIDSVEAYCKARNLVPPIYNIELKTSPRYDSLGYNAPPQEMVNAVIDVVESKSIGNRFYLQSFDIRPLQFTHVKYPGAVVGFLTDSNKSVEENLADLGFAPHIYSPHFNLVTQPLVDQCKKQKMKVIPWTVNNKEKMTSLISLGVDGIITDYPNYFTELGIR